MNWKELPAKRTAKLLSLILTSLLIASVSATVYFSMNMQATVTISTPMVTFTTGNDTAYSSGSIGANASYVELSVKAYPNATLTYDDVINLTCGGTGVDLKLSGSSISPASGNAAVANFTFINFTVWDESGVYKGSVNYTTSGTTWSSPSMNYTSIDASDEWYVKIQTKAKANAWANTATIVLSVDVREST